MARPRKKIDYELLRSLRGIMCTDGEIASVLKISHDTISRRKRDDAAFAEAYESGLNEGRISLRRAQFQSAVRDGNTTMLIWLGKQYLGQTDNRDFVRGRDIDREHPLSVVVPPGCSLDIPLENEDKCEK